MENHYVYIIRGVNIISGRVKYYIGYTINLGRRIKQHNRILKGGAKATLGYKWEYLGFFSNLGSRIYGLKMEWKLKHSSRKYNIDIKLKNFIKWYEIFGKTILVFYINTNFNIKSDKIIIYNNLFYKFNFIDFIIKNLYNK